MDRVTGPETEADLLRIVQEALDGLQAVEREVGTITTAEFAAHLDMGTGAAARRLKQLVEAGVLEPAMVRRTNLWKHTRATCGYRLVKAD